MSPIFKTIKPLVVTPAANEHESLMGFVLRASEMNGFHTPKLILMYSGMSELESRSSRPPIDLLAPLFNVSTKELGFSGYQLSTSPFTRKQWRLCGSEIPALYINIKQIRICVECIRESGYIHSFWELKHAIACPIHKKVGLTHCPSCAKSLSWNRRGQLKCVCKYDLSESYGEQLDEDSYVQILRVIQLKLESVPLNDPGLLKYGLPVQELEKISLSTFIKIIGRFTPRKNDMGNTKSPEEVIKEGLKVSYSVFRNWPYGLYDYLDSIAPVPNELKGFGLDIDFRAFYNHMFNSYIEQKEIEFIYKIYVAYGNERWKRNAIDKRSADRANIQPQLVGINGVAKHLGINVPTVLSYLKRGKIVGTWVKRGAQERLLFDVTKLPFRKSEGKYYRFREAAKFVDMYPEHLRHLRNEEIYQVKRLAYGLDGFSELDLIEFKASLLNKVVEENHCERDVISFKHICRKKYVGKSYMAKIIQAILDCSLAPISGSTINSLVFWKTQVEEVLGLKFSYSDLEVKKSKKKKDSPQESLWDIY